MMLTSFEDGQSGVDCWVRFFAFMCSTVHSLSPVSTGGYLGKTLGILCMVCYNGSIFDCKSGHRLVCWPVKAWNRCFVDLSTLHI